MLCLWGLETLHQSLKSGLFLLKAARVKQRNKIRLSHLWALQLVHHLMQLLLRSDLGVEWTGWNSHLWLNWVSNKLTLISINILWSWLSLDLWSLLNKLWSWLSLYLWGLVNILWCWLSLLDLWLSVYKFILSIVKNILLVGVVLNKVILDVSL